MGTSCYKRAGKPLSTRPVPWKKALPLIAHHITHRSHAVQVLMCHCGQTCHGMLAGLYLILLTFYRLYPRIVPSGLYKKTPFCVIVFRPAGSGFLEEPAAVRSGAIKQRPRGEPQLACAYEDMLANPDARRAADPRRASNAGVAALEPFQGPPGRRRPARGRRAAAPHWLRKRAGVTPVLRLNWR